MDQHFLFHRGMGVDAIVLFQLQLHLMRPGVKQRLAVSDPVYGDLHDGIIGKLVIDAEHCQNIVLHHGVLHLFFVCKLHAGVVDDEGEAVGLLRKQLRRNFIDLCIVLHGAGYGENQRIKHQSGKEEGYRDGADFQPALGGPVFDFRLFRRCVFFHSVWLLLFLL